MLWLYLPYITLHKYQFKLLISIVTTLLFLHLSMHPPPRMHSSSIRCFQLLLPHILTYSYPRNLHLLILLFYLLFQTLFSELCCLNTLDSSKRYPRIEMIGKNIFLLLSIIQLNVPFLIWTVNRMKTLTMLLICL